MKILMLGIDLGKNLCSLAGLDETGAIVLRRRLKRESLLRFTARLEVCTVAMEACCGAHHLGRQIAEQGHRVRLMSLHRVRRRLVSERTALINQLRALLLERGITAPQGRRKLERLLSEILADEDNGLGVRRRPLIQDMRSEWGEVDERITVFNAELTERARADDGARRLITIPGVGVLTATALVAAVGNARTFARGRDLAAWLGLAPRQATTGGKPRLLGISKRGNRYLRMLLIHGARTALPSLAQSDTPLGRWLKGLLERTHRNVATVALANKLARIAWAVLAHDRRFIALDTAAG